MAAITAGMVATAQQDRRPDDGMQRGWPKLIDGHTRLKKFCASSWATRLWRKAAARVAAEGIVVSIAADGKVGAISSTRNRFAAKNDDFTFWPMVCVQAGCRKQSG